MRHRSVGDLMTPTAVTVRPDSTFKEIARLLDEYDITAVPVVDDNGRPVGVVSEADLIRKQTSTGVGSSARELMTSPAVVAEPGWNAGRAALPTAGSHSAAPSSARAWSRWSCGSARASTVWWT